MKLLVAALELADLVDAVVVDALREVDWHFYFLCSEELFNEVVDLPERQFEDVFAGQRRHDVEASGVFVEFLAVHESQLHEIVPAEASAEKDALKVLLHVPALKATPATQPLEQPKSFMRGPQFLEAVLEVLDEDLGYLFAARADDEPLQHKLLEGDEAQPLLGDVVVEEDLVDGEDVDEAAGDVLAEGERSDHVLQELQRDSSCCSAVGIRAFALRNEEHLGACVYLDRDVLLPVADLLLQLGHLVD